MDQEGLGPLMRVLAVRNLAIDQLAAEVAAAFGGNGIQSLILKGPVLAQWIYPGQVRPYGDADLMVAPQDWPGAVDCLTALGFSNYLGPMDHPRMESFASTAFLRGEDNLDLHCTIHGLEAPPPQIWDAFSGGAETQVIGGSELRIPDRAALLLHVCLHAAHHHEGKPLEDLRRAIDKADETLWQDALKLARELEGEQTFASGLRLVPKGEEIARRLGISEVRSAKHEVRFEAVPTAEGIDTLLSGGIPFRERVGMVARELFPTVRFMRWWSPLARRGTLGLIASYLWRWLWLAFNLPKGLRTVMRVRRGRPPASSG